MSYSHVIILIIIQYFEKYFTESFCTGYYFFVLVIIEVGNGLILLLFSYTSYANFIEGVFDRFEAATVNSQKFRPS